MRAESKIAAVRKVGIERKTTDRFQWSVNTSRHLQGFRCKCGRAWRISPQCARGGGVTRRSREHRVALQPEQDEEKTRALFSLLNPGAVHVLKKNGSN